MKESNVQTELNVTGMHCANCAISIHIYLEESGAKEIYVDFASDEVKFSDVPEHQVSQLVKGIESLGYKVVKDKNSKVNDNNGNDQFRFHFSKYLSLKSISSRPTFVFE